MVGVAAVSACITAVTAFSDHEMLWVIAPISGHDCLSSHNLLLYQICSLRSSRTVYPILGSGREGDEKSASCRGLNTDIFH